MRKKQLAALICGFILTAQPLPAYAAETQAAAKPETVIMETVCPDFIPLGSDQIMLTGLAYNRCSVKIVQHSPERKNLLLYESSFTPEYGKNYVFPAEPGSYSIEITAESVFSASAVRIFNDDFTIENPDYAKSAEPFTHSVYGYVCKLLRAEDDDAGKPEQLGKELETLSDSVKYTQKLIGFPRYARKRGDFDGDGEITAADAQLLLNVYADVLAELSPTVLPAVMDACDADGSRTLDAADAQDILRYYTEEIAGNIPHWNDGSTDSAYDPAYADHSAVFPGEKYELSIELVPYFADAAPKTESERKKLTAAAEALLKKQKEPLIIKAASENQNTPYAFSVDLSLKPQLGSRASAEIKNPTRFEPDLIDYTVPANITLPESKKPAVIELPMFVSTGAEYPCYCSSAALEYNINTGEIRLKAE